MTDAEFQIFLDDVSTCFLQRDFDLWQSRIALPFSMVTQAGPVVLETVDELRDNFDLYIVACKSMHLDNIVRLPISLEDCQDGTWLGTYQTHLMSGGQRATDPYTSTAMMSQYAGVWKMTSILNARGHHQWTGQSPARLRMRPPQGTAGVST